MLTPRMAWFSYLMPAHILCYTTTTANCQETQQSVTGAAVSEENNMVEIL